MHDGRTDHDGKALPRLSVIFCSLIIGAAAASWAEAAFAADSSPPPIQPVQPVAPDAAATTEDEDRALERVLVEQGGLLLPPYVVEMAPSVSYTYNSTSGVQINTINGQSVGSLNSVRTDTFQFNLAARLGLPYNFQLEATVPYIITDQRSVYNNLNTQHSSGSNLGDTVLGLRYQVPRPGEKWPNILLDAQWKSTSGSSSSSTPSTLATGTGYDSLQGSVTLVKSQDPLVFLGSAAYTHNFNATVNGENVDPGDDFEVRVGTVLAASPETSLRVDLDSTFMRKNNVQDAIVPGSDRVSSLVDFGLGTILARNLLLDTQVSVGLTDSAPNVEVTVTLDYRFQ